MAATLKSLAQQLNLSHTTVAKILKNSPDFRTTEETRQRVHALADELGYRPTIAARHLLSGKTRHIGLLLHDLHDPFFANIAHGVEKAVAVAGYSLVLGLGPLEESVNVSKPFDPTQWYIDGLIAGLFGYYPKGAFAHWNRRMPVVALGAAAYGENTFPEVVENHVPYIDFNQFEGSRSVGRHLVSQGCQRIAYLGWPDPKRTEGLRSGVQESGGTIEEIFLSYPYTSELATSFEDRFAVVQNALHQRLNAPTAFPDALFCFNDIVAQVAFGLLRRYGLRVPEDVCLVGFNNDPDSPYREVPLTTVAVPVEEMCRVAVSTLLLRLEGEENQPPHIMLEPTLIVRDSSRRNHATI